MSATPFLQNWFDIMDSDDPDRVLDLISDDFVMSVLFSSGAGQAAEFIGDRAGLIGYLEQREKSMLVHEILFGGLVHGTELASGQTTRHGEFEASFNATAVLVDGKVRRLLMCRSPELAFT